MKDKIKIVRIQSRICIGGPAMHTILLSSNLNPHQFETLLIGGGLDPGERSLVPYARSLNIRVVEIGEIKRNISPVSDIRAIVRLYRLLRSENPDIVETHTAKAGTLGRIAALLARVPVRIHMFHGHVFEGYFNKAKSRMFVYLERCLSRISTRILVLSARQYHDLVHKYRIAPSAKVEIMPLALDDGQFTGIESARGGLRKELGVDNTCVLIGILGRLVPIKNHELLIRAAHSICKRDHGHNVRFLIIGDGELRTGLEERAKRMDMAEYVLFLGYRTDVLRIMADLDILALTSDNEGTPVSIMEAMMCGVPVISTDVGGVRDILPEECGIIVPSGNEAQFIDGLKKLLDNKSLRRSLGKAGLLYAREHFGTQRLIRQAERIYRSLLKCG